VKVRTLEEVAAYLEDVSARADKSQSPQEQYEHFEMLAIQILDSDFDLYPDGVLQGFLMKYLAIKRSQLSL